MGNAVHAQKLLNRVLMDRYNRFSSSRHLHDRLQNVFGLVYAAAGVPHQPDNGLPAAARSTSRTIWPKVQFRYHYAFHFFRDRCDLFLGERPRGDQPELADLNALAVRAMSIARCATREVIP